MNPPTQQTQTTQELQRQEEEDIILLQKFWRTYDDIVILSLFAIFGIVFRMASATWFRLELGVVFSEDSALSTNLPLNCWSCFLMGLLCSGKEAMGIVHAKVLGGANPYGSGKGIIAIGKGAARGVIDAGRAGINRARGYGNIHRSAATRDDSCSSSVTSENNNVDRIDATPVNELQTPQSRVRLQQRRGRGTPSSPARRKRHQLSPPNNNRTNQRSVSRELASPPVSQGSDESIAGLLGLDEEFRIGSHNNSEDEIREVQLRGLTRRIMASPSLVFFPAKKEDVDVMEHYENNVNPSSGDDAIIVVRQSTATTNTSSPTLPGFVPEDLFEIGDIEDDDEESGVITVNRQLSPSGESSGQVEDVMHDTIEVAQITPRNHSNETQNVSDFNLPEAKEIQTTSQQPPPAVARQISNTIEEEIDEMFHTVSAQISNFRRIHVADGWDVGTSPEEMKHNILLGFRVGFCGAVSTFSSWNSAMINLLKSGKVGEAIIGYILGIQLGIISYRFGQHIAVYIFVWRCRREAKRDEKRGYGIRLRNSDADDSEDVLNTVAVSNSRNLRRVQTVVERDVPSVRALATSVFVMILISLCSALYFFPKHQQFSISLLFTPFGCLARWILTKKYNSKLPGFPLGTFACNLLSCALSGSLGSIIAGNPGPEERIVLTSMIAGFAGSLSTFAAFIVGKSVFLLFFTLFNLIFNKAILLDFSSIDTMATEKNY
mmetsp:Transcript_25994/g.53780  ORF Transcript_25994/g.53780 Transcript_25994/m.53780 type:complete len:718 (+) Transcript_25994:582-2735(+)